MYLNFKQHSKKKYSKKVTAFFVLSIHIFVLLLVFLIFCVKGCTTTNLPNSITVNIVASSQQSSEPLLSQQKNQQNVKQIQEEPTPKKIQEEPTPKKTWKALDPSQIMKSTKTIVKKEPTPRASTVEASDIAGNIRQEIKKIRFNNTYSANKSILTYYDKVSQYLYAEWEQPARSIIYNQMPVVKVRVLIDRNGTILKSSIISKSGNASMDSSVVKLLSTLSTLPPPPEGPMEFDVYLELTH